ncbi:MULTISPECIES: DinB family protein [unclassified Pseudomonas]|uniref:DinB family protein n=1 Tax=unclassified Pseudomonas TaxID=196821 RepID=UPI002AC8DBF6|nr:MULTISPECIES: DinB family protein [unclassified Pseudomonas]MEB0046773.1 DinB family protein [Pseudomonas sp. Dout3]MEB0097619.1 DinB family protein [Pseudomonas sp. DC1.2]WPX61267.1 DinB family protein [Pseudomonas sp. DC1.2]
MKQPLSHHLLTLAYQNAWANHRLAHAWGQLSADELVALRVSFFPGIRQTLNHILTCDWFYVDALERELRGAEPHADCYVFFKDDEPFTVGADLRREQVQVDRRLIAYCEQLRDADLGRLVMIARDTPQHDSRLRMLSHLFQHQTHHRGQVHAMLSGTSIKPPQLDEFFCAGEAGARAQDFAELGWTEALVWGH